MTKTLFAGVAAFALLVGTTGAGAIDDVEGNSTAVSIGDVENETGTIDHRNAVSANAMQQVVANSVGVEEISQLTGEFAHHGMDFGSNTFERQVLDVNNFALGINQAQQGAVSIAVQANFGDTGNGE